MLWGSAAVAAPCGDLRNADASARADLKSYSEAVSVLSLHAQAAPGDSDLILFVAGAGAEFRRPGDQVAADWALPPAHGQPIGLEPQPAGLNREAAEHLLGSRLADTVGVWRCRNTTSGGSTKADRSYVSC
jgi:hypothetical protein